MLAEELFGIWRSLHNRKISTLDCSKGYRNALSASHYNNGESVIAALFVWGFIEYTFFEKYGSDSKPSWLLRLTAWLQEIDPLPPISNDLNVTIRYIQRGRFNEVIKYCNQIPSLSHISKLLESHPLISGKNNLPDYNEADELNMVLFGRWDPQDPKLFPHALLARLIYHHCIPKDDDALEECLENDPWIKKKILENPFNEAIALLLIKDLTASLSIIHSLHFQAFVHLVDLIQYSGCISRQEIPNFDKIHEDIMIKYVEHELLAEKTPKSLFRHWTIGFCYLETCKHDGKPVLKKLTKILLAKRGTDPIFMNNLVQVLCELGHQDLVYQIIYEPTVEKFQKHNNYASLVLMLGRLPKDHHMKNELAYHSKYLMSPSIRKQCHESLIHWYLHVNESEIRLCHEWAPLILYSKFLYNQMQKRFNDALVCLVELLGWYDIPTEHHMIYSLMIEAFTSIEMGSPARSICLFLLRLLEESIIYMDRKLHEDELIISERIRLCLMSIMLNN